MNSSSSYDNRQECTNEVGNGIHDGGGSHFTAIHNVGGEHSQLALHSSDDREIVAAIIA